MAFRYAYQGGPCVIVFSHIDKLTLAMSDCSKYVRKEFDESAKTYIFVMMGESFVQQIYIHRDRRRFLGLTQPYLVFQISLFETRKFSIEIRTTSVQGNKRGFILSTSRNCIKCSALTARVPLNIRSNAWTHVCISLDDIIFYIWHDDFRTIDSIAIYGSCKLRQIFTLKELVKRGSDATRPWDIRYYENLPKQCCFPRGVNQKCLVVAKDYVSVYLANCRNPPKNTGYVSAQSVYAKMMRDPKGSQPPVPGNTLEPSQLVETRLLQPSKETFVESGVGELTIAEKLQNTVHTILNTSRVTEQVSPMKEAVSEMDISEIEDTLENECITRVTDSLEQKEDILEIGNSSKQKENIINVGDTMRQKDASADMLSEKFRELNLERNGSAASSDSERERESVNLQSSRKRLEVWFPNPPIRSENPSEVSSIDSGLTYELSYDDCE